MPTVRISKSQLALFPVRKKHHPTPTEFAKQCVVADVCRLWISPGWKWTHLPFGEYRLPSTAGKLKRMGVMPGWPDFVFVNPVGLHHYVEMKRDREVVKGGQDEMKEFLEGAGCPYLLSKSVDEILATLSVWGALRPDAKW